MSLSTQNPTQTKAWQTLKALFESKSGFHMRNLFLDDEQREEKYTLRCEDMTVNFSKNRISDEVKKGLVSLVEELDLKSGIDQMFKGEPINVTEERAVLHTALRNRSSTPIFVDGVNIMPEIERTLAKMKTFSEEVITGTFRGFTGEKITDVVNIGIGGSDLGPRMVVDALKFYANHLKIHFVSNVDGDHIMEVLKDLNPETTLFLIVSKSFNTQETLSNAETIKRWFLKDATEEDIQHNFVAVSANLEKAASFGIAAKNVFPMWNWVGGRYSLWSAVGLSISLAIGFDKFEELLDGANLMDQHFQEKEYAENIPVMMALVSVWNTNFYQADTEVVVPYSQYLTQFVPFLQQLSMESNGKSVDRAGNPINYQTGAIIWGNTGTNAQHAFMQLVHQGTRFIPVDFIGFHHSLYGNQQHHEMLMANFYAQAEALYLGKSEAEAHLDLKTKGLADKIPTLLPFKVFEGNKPSNSVIFDRLSPKSLGMLIAFYEHKTFVQGFIWNIFSFDQFGVELGKEMAHKSLTKS
ncbi:glucose-6-phosphate isomerase [Flavobacteriaceae bacterium F08102]|nr:glucose-6-phosphate isomerase [Flavobacteriaceae bacterium F08102]